MARSKSGELTCIYSSPFYTDEYGYKLCLRLYMNGDGKGEGTHLSIFVAVMKNYYDALLQWPINKMVSIELLDQSPHIESRQNHEALFLTNPKSRSFQRPVTDMNVASGISQFIPLSELTFKTTGDAVDGLPWHVVDNQMFFKVKVMDPPKAVDKKN
ncbi:MATH domain-containing protein, partial [Sansalvadorimonas verongulae]|uniref:hypothetical protein n=1 Tax=Sansalvadorimonas verongulae TaxID=2172824 RepID=UPI0012BCA2CE